MAGKWFSKEEKLNILSECDQGNNSVKEIAEKYGIHAETIREWRTSHDMAGVESLERSKRHKFYPAELKYNAVKDFLSGRYSQREISRKYKISSKSVLMKWVELYNGHKTLKDSGRGRNRLMTKRKNVSLEERIEIAKDCLAHGKDYARSMEIHQVSYQQVYQWVKKYQEGGEEALKDNRGKRKTEEELTPEEKIQRENKRLEQENERLRAENAFLKKLEGDQKEAVLSQVRYEDRYLAILELNRKEGFSVQMLCEIAEVSRQGYYKWRSRVPSAREKQNEKIIAEMTLLHEQIGGIYGYRRMTLNMKRRFKERLNHKRIYRLMKIAKLECVIRRKKKRYGKATPQHVSENILNREFKADKPNQKWVTDVTELKYGHRKAYLSAILDLHEGMVVSYVLGKSNNNALVFKTLNQALEAAPNARPLLHSDRGFQYTSHQFRRMIENANMTQSMSRVGRCIDNGPIESFWGKLKCEKYRRNSYETFEALQSAIDEYIHFYNHDRLQEKLNGLSPVEYRAKAV
ncbi:MULTISPECIES: IS3 family transposase [Bacillus]|uniref:IS3 family transposase n=2 Tax=Bacillaceae TaxID=186817 RepID=UPI001E381D7F|nr:IS3 family transposase [Bacillus glycinifermentans]WKB76592.1 IS3 family transposase [Bacillus glycinifermentans]WKB77139.1 IS3 family transposase [Bacillus glycinifermentans]WKB78848.1 IS3 family transposase [Bacillus glycinifermentans]